MASDLPHIIFIMTDQQRGDTLGSINSRILTPTLDALAKEGILFSNAYTSVPSCTPARAGILTGLSPWHHGQLGYGKVADHYPFEMPQMLRDVGYYTVAVGKMHWTPQRSLHGLHQLYLDESRRAEEKGFVSDYHAWFHTQAPDSDPYATGLGSNDNRYRAYVPPENLHPTAWTGNRAVEVINQHNTCQPLFLKVSFARPHSPYDPPPRWLAKYRWEDMPKPWKGTWTVRFQKFKHIDSPYWGDFGDEFAQKARQHYYANISFIDEQIGRIISALKQQGMYDNTLILFTADHGDMLGDHYHWRKTYAYEGSAKIPMILRWPSSWTMIVDRGTRMPYPVELRDVLPTFLEASGLPIPSAMDGKSLLTLLRSTTPTWREFIDLEHATCYHWRNAWVGLTDGKSKYIYFRSTGDEQFFDLIQDPGEEHDLSTDKDAQERVKLWRNRLMQHLQERGFAWVKRGKLVKNRRTILYSPNYSQSKKIP